MSHQRTIDVQDGDDKWLADWLKDVETLYELVVEEMETEPRMLLSPVVRRVTVEHAHKLKRIHASVAPALCLDNPVAPMVDRLK